MAGDVHVARRGATVLLATVPMILAGGLVAYFGVMGARGRLPRNNLVGVRTRASMRSDRAFEVANRTAAPATIAAGTAAAVSGVTAGVLPDPAAPVSLLVGVVLLLVLLVIATVQGNRAARSADI